MTQPIHNHALELPHIQSRKNLLNEYRYAIMGVSLTLVIISKVIDPSLLIYSICLLVALGITILFYPVKNYVSLGTIELSKTHIAIRSRNNKAVFDLSEIENLNIVYSYSEDSYYIGNADAQLGKQWIEFSKNGETHRYFYIFKNYNYLLQLKAMLDMWHKDQMKFEEYNYETYKIVEQSNQEEYNTIKKFIEEGFGITETESKRPINI